ncbi:50S ribosomal protein L32e [Candidatus Woesearchaeota archaeon]|nr:50S ribosomal protein L32e [Candidatus Woesearchaeota archaeon]
MSIQNLLEIRKEIKERKPDFIRQDNPKRMKVNDKWRKPKGIHSKIRHKFKGRRKMPSPGYKSPAEVKGLHSSGLEIVNVHSIGELKKINRDKEGIIVAKATGMKKRLEVFKKAKELNINILNLNIDEQIKKIEDFISSKKKKAPEAKKEEVKKEKETKAKVESEKSKENTELSDKDKKEIEKKEQDKILTKRT